MAISVHEASHAATANWLGDPTARRMGRMTLNPLRHLDVFGTFFILVVGFGWGKPVLVDETPPASRPTRGGIGLGGRPAGQSGDGAPRRERAGDRGGRSARMFAVPGLTWRVGILIRISIILTAFNFLPIPPLDGFGALLGVLPGELAEQLERLRQYGPSYSPGQCSC